MRSLLFIALVSISACAAQQDLDSSDQLDAPTGKEDAASRPAGAYSNATPHYGELSTLSLMADHTFTLTEIGACAGGGTCAPITEHGRFLFTHGTTKSYIRLYAEDGSSLDRYQWKLGSRGELQLELDGDSHWFTMTRGGSCEAAGGTCVPLVPDACYIGSIGDATEYSCGGGVGVECCLPPQPDTACHAASDCGGILPQFCRQCDDGSTSCAHWSCVANACQIATCN